MKSDVELQGLSIGPLLRGDDPAAFILLKLNPLVNTITRLLENPFRLKTSEATYKAIDEKSHAATAQNDEELELLRLVRDGAYNRISIELKNGKILSAEAEKAISKSQHD